MSEAGGRSPRDSFNTMGLTTEKFMVGCFSC